MKIKLDKNYTKDYQIENVKRAITDFKGYFNEKELLRMYEETFGDISIYSSRKIVETNVSAFASNDYTDDVSFLVEMLICIEYREYHELKFYVGACGDIYTISEDENLHTDNVFVRR